MTTNVAGINLIACRNGKYQCEVKIRCGIWLNILKVVQNIHQLLLSFIVSCCSLIDVLLPARLLTGICILLFALVIKLPTYLTCLWCLHNNLFTIIFASF